MVKKVLLCSSVILLALAIHAAAAQMWMPNLFVDHMVVQRDKPLLVWGWAEPGEQMRVTLHRDTQIAAKVSDIGHSLEAQARAEGGRPMDFTDEALARYRAEKKC